MSLLAQTFPGKFFARILRASFPEELFAQIPDHLSRKFVRANVPELFAQTFPTMTALPAKLTYTWDLPLDDGYVGPLAWFQHLAVLAELKLRFAGEPTGGTLLPDDNGYGHDLGSRS